MDKGRQEIPLQGKDFWNSRKLRKVVAIYKTNKLVLSKKYISLKTRGSEKVPYSKSCSRLIFCNQLIKCSVFLVSFWAITVSPCLTVVELTRPYFILSRCPLKNRRMGIAVNSSVLTYSSFVIKNLKNLCLTDFYLHRTVCKQKNIWRLKVNQYFRPVIKMGPKPGKTSVIIKWLL